MSQAWQFSPNFHCSVTQSFSYPEHMMPPLITVVCYSRLEASGPQLVIAFLPANSIGTGNHVTEDGKCVCVCVSSGLSHLIDGGDFIFQSLFNPNLCLDILLLNSTIRLCFYLRFPARGEVSACEHVGRYIQTTVVFRCFSE